jgi:hypothetical protein
MATKGRAWFGGTSWVILEDSFSVKDSLESGYQFSEREVGSARSVSKTGYFSGNFVLVDFVSGCPEDNADMLRPFRNGDDTFGVDIFPDDLRGFHGERCVLASTDFDSKGRLVCKFWTRQGTLLSKTESLEEIVAKAIEDLS